jgi:hypothetical protein
MEAARSMIYSNPDIPQFLWAEAVNMAVYVINRTGPTRVDGKTPYELWFDKKPKIDNLKVFGTECFVHKYQSKNVLNWTRKLKEGTWLVIWKVSKDIVCGFQR